MTASFHGPEAGSVSLSGFSVFPRIGSTVSFWCAQNDEPVRVVATVATYYGRDGRRIFSLAHQGRTFQAEFVTTEGRLHIAPIDERGGTPASYLCDVRGPAS